MAEAKFGPGDRVRNGKLQRYVITHRCANDTRLGVPRYVATLLGARPRSVTIVETGLEKEGNK